LFNQEGEAEASKAELEEAELKRAEAELSEMEARHGIIRMPGNLRFERLGAPASIFRVSEAEFEAFEAKLAELFPKTGIRPGDATDAGRIALHAFMKHVVLEGEFPEVKSVDQLRDQVVSIMRAPTASRPLSNGRTAFWFEPTQTLVISNPRVFDRGTIYRPFDGVQGYLKLK
jgi:filamentous hemagglutinin